MTQPVANERRLNPRATVALDLNLARTIGNAVTVRTLDLSVGGARVLSERPLGVDEEMQFDLDLRVGGPHLNGRVRVLRQHRHDTYALRFERIGPDVLRDLTAFVDANVGAPLS